MKTNLLSMLAIAIAFSGCQISNRKDAEDDSDKYSYDLDINGCATGKQSFSSKSSYCKGLADEALNKGCAKSERQEMYSRECGQWPEDSISGPGSFNEPLVPAVTNLLDKRLTGNAVARGNEYFAAALTIRNDRTYTLELARGLTPTVDAASGTSVESDWKATGAEIFLLGSGDATAGSVGSKPGVTLVIGIPGESSGSLTFQLAAP